MDRYSWRARVKEGCLEEYIERHNNIWPEMSKMLNDAGIRNYTIWNVGNELFGYYECDDIEYTHSFQANSTVNQEWQKFMADIMDAGLTPDKRARPRQVFLHEGKLPKSGD